MRVYCPVCRLEVEPADPPHVTLDDCTQALATSEASLKDGIRSLLERKVQDATRMPRPPKPPQEQT
jgi:hypothetical protein